MTDFPVDTHLGGLALCTDRPQQAIEHLTRAAALQERAGALPGLAYTLSYLARALEARGLDDDDRLAADARSRARTIGTQLGMQLFLDGLTPATDEWTLRREGADWTLVAGAERAVLRDARGLHYLRTLVGAPRHEIAALTLASDGELAATAGGDVVLDEQTIAAYRERLAHLDAAAEAADLRGDAERAAEVHAERTAILVELQRGVGLGGRAREFASEAERARISVTKALRTALDRIEEQAPLAATHLRNSLRTGRYCRYEPAPNGPSRWVV
jgi:hypothetical protein